MSVFEIAKKYYQDYTPPLWDENRLNTLVKANKLTQEEKNEIIMGKISQPYKYII